MVLRFFNLFHKEVTVCDRIRRGHVFVQTQQMRFAVWIRKVHARRLMTRLRALKIEGRFQVLGVLFASPTNIVVKCMDIYTNTEVQCFCISIQRFL